MKPGIILPTILSFVFVFVLTSAAGLGWQQKIVEKEKSQLNSISDEVSKRLHIFIQGRLNSTDFLIDQMRLKPLEDDWFRLLSGSVRKVISGFQAINYVDFDKTIRLVTPLAGNEKALGKNLANHPVSPLLDLAKGNDSPVMSKPIELYQGGLGFTTYSPIFRDGIFVGWLNTVFRLKDLLSEFDSFDRQTIIKIIDRDSGRVIFQKTPENHDHNDQHSIVKILSFLNQQWIVQVCPDGDGFIYHEKRDRNIIILLCFLFALMISLLVKRVFDSVNATEKALAKSRKDNTLLRTVVHDLSTPITVISVYIDKLLKNSVSSEEDQKIGGQIKKSVEMQTDIIRHVKEIESLKLRDFQIECQLLKFSNLREKIQFIGDELSKLKGVRFEITDTESMEHDFLAESHSLVHHVIANLISNAIKFTEPGKTVQLSVQAEESFVRIHVADEGIGISRQIREALFDESKISSRKGTSGELGTGLGLILVKSYVEAYGGRIQVKSLPEREVGTEFIVFLKRA